MDEFINQVRAGQKNLIALYAFVAASQFWVAGTIHRSIPRVTTWQCNWCDRNSWRDLLVAW
ncbi:hypothetical protein ATW55_03770 [Ferroacidibacillus organovorans]|uniref:Uncharacterized protein n=1 Tax=Ferroacidibacillus organovorans TaxID=1765683 RepID=A0A101XRR4_9BACL|nr:hypothetical protein ATW55_03770 [Ferroacidibacillus organovorans]